MQIVSYNDYKEYIEDMLIPLNDKQRSIFGYYCCRYLIDKYASHLKDDFDPRDVDSLQKVLVVIALSLHQTTDQRLLTDSLSCILNISVDEEGDATHIHPHSLRILSCLGACLQLLLHPGNENAIQCSDLVIDSLDYELARSNPDYVSDSLSHMFRYTEMSSLLGKITELIDSINANADPKVLDTKLS